MNFIKNMPIAVSGLLLATLSLGNLLDNILVKTITLTVGLIIISILLLKLILYYDEFSKEINQLVVLSTAGTFSMALMVLSTYIITINYFISLILWIIGILLHITIIIVFTYKYIIHNFDIENVYGSYWVVYIGITMAAITGSTFGLTSFTWIFFVFGFIMMIPTFLLITYRYLYYPVTVEANKPLICIYTALFSILTVGYVSSFDVNLNFIICIYLVACCCYVFSLYKLITYIRMPFYPSFSVFTFPFVISAVASSKILLILPTNIIVRYIVTIQTGLATILVLYVLIMYVRNIILVKGE